MNTKNIPALIMLTAGFIAAMTMILKGRDTRDYLITLILVLVIFYMLGLIVKFILDKYIKMEDENQEEEGEETEDEPLEDIPIVEGEDESEGDAQEMSEGELANIESGQ